VPNFDVFSEIEVAHGGSDTLWKFRASVMAPNAIEAIDQVAETDALNNSPGTEKKYAACRSSCWETRLKRFTVRPETVGLDKAEEPAKV
jgi:hypothetical protein